MTRRDDLSRRTLATALAGLSLAALVPTQGRAGPLDQGIGGTGVAPEPEERKPDRGIGGTGFVGTIRRFGSIFVNGTRIAYAKTARVSIDDVAAGPAALKIGHVVRLTAIRRRGVWSADLIQVVSEVVGPVDAVDSEGLVVLRQRISTAELEGAESWRVGDSVAVSGLRQADGTIVASLIEQRPTDGPHVVGPVVRGSDGVPAIAGLRLQGLHPALVGVRCHVQGRLSANGLVVTTAAAERDLLIASHPRQLSVEAFVQGNSAAITLGSGLAVSAPRGRLPQAFGSETRAVVSIDIRRNGDFAVQGIRPTQRSGQGGGSGQPRSRSPNEHHRGSLPGGPPDNGAGHGSGGAASGLSHIGGSHDGSKPGGRR